VDLYSTGYYTLKGGMTEGPGGAEGQLAAIKARIQQRNVGEYFAASPATLEIGYGSNISSGMIYGKDLIFDPGISVPRTTVKGASYLNSISPPDYANYVTFLDPGNPIQTDTEPTLPHLDAAMRNQYALMAGSAILDPNVPLSGLIDEPTANSYKVWYGAGDVHLGIAGSSATFTDTMLIYSEGIFISITR
jgi:hypothetical protein